MDFSFDMETFQNSLLIMAQGMAGIFAALLLIMISVWIMSKLGSIGKKDKTEE